MTVSIVSWTSLVLGLVGVLFAGCALLARGGTIDRLSMWYLGFGLTGSELPALLATLGVVLAAAAWALGADAHAAGRVAMVLHVLAVAGLLWALWRARGTFSVIDGTLRQAFGPDYEQGIAPTRRALLQRMREQPELQAVEADFLHLLSSWFNPGFLRLERVDWNSPAQLLEQIIRHEAVHQIDGWDDLRRRLQPDRRCFAFFHPQLPAEPLIFVEVALLPAMPAAIAPLIDKASAPLPASQFKVAAFYSISNCQPGLKGVSLGNFLIKRVADELKRELPQLKTFCTLSPIPGFARWVKAGARCEGLPKARAQRLLQAHAAVLDACGGDLDKLAQTATLRALPEPGGQALLRLAAYYLGWHATAADGDPVARFHLDNGARLERLDPLGDLSEKGRRQSWGMMVNYLYDLDRIEAHHEKFVHGEVAQSRLLTSLL